MYDEEENLATQTPLQRRYCFWYMRKQKQVPLIIALPCGLSLWFPLKCFVCDMRTANCCVRREYQTYWKFSDGVCTTIPSLMSYMTF